MALGAGVWAAWNGWLRTRRFVPLDMAVTERQSPNLHADLRLNFDGLYLIELENHGINPSEAQPAMIDAEWNVQQGGKEIARGSSRDRHSPATEQRDRVRVIGEFRGEAGREYELTVNFAAGTPLDQLKPVLRVAVSGLARENLQAASVLVFSTMFICELFGLILVGIGISGKRGAA